MEFSTTPAQTSRAVEGHGCGDHHCTDDNTENNLPDAHNRRSLHENTGMITRPVEEENAPLVSRETVVHNRHLHCEND
jgi:hypothetical protein